MPATFPTLLQIADSAFPTGAFAYSNGLEALARAGSFPDLTALENYMEAYLRQAESFDLAFFAAAYALPHGEAGLGDLCREWDAYFWNPAILKASLRQGRALLDMLCETFPQSGVIALRQRVAADDWPLHFVPALGHSLSLLGASQPEAHGIYLHGLVRDQMAAALRLGLIGPRTAQAMQARILAGSEFRSGAPALEAAWRTAPLTDVGQGCHAFLYSRLFQN